MQHACEARIKFRQTFPTERVYLEDAGIDEIILNLIFKKLNAWMWIGFVCLRIGGKFLERISSHEGHSLVR
jgi:hypothetical protein